MALISGGAGGRARRRTPTQAYWPTGRTEDWMRTRPPGRALPAFQRGPLTTGGPPAPFMGGSWVGDWVQPRREPSGVTITVPETAPAWQPTPGWGGGGGGGAPAAPTPPVAPPITPTPWGQYAQPLYGGEGIGDWLNMSSQDWAALPSDVRRYMETWLRGMGWRPGPGGWGRYGARQWGRARGAEPWTRGAYMGEQAFTGIPENLKPWIYWLSGQKGWRAGGREAERPGATGWGW